MRRALVGLLAALLLLSGYSLTAKTYEKVIACGMLDNSTHPSIISYMTPYLTAFGIPISNADLVAHPQVFKWSTNRSNFTYARSIDYKDCGLESVGQLCRGHYDNVSYAVDLNETKTLPVYIPWFDKPANVNETVEARLFKCQDYIPAKEPIVPKGSWSDKLSTWSCRGKGDWLKPAEDECGQKPTDISYGGQCRDLDKYLEIVFVCDQPKSRTIFEADTGFLQSREDYFHNSQFATLQRFAEISEKLLEAHSKNESDSIRAHRRELDGISSTVLDIVRNAHSLAELSTVERKEERALLLHDSDTYDSRELMFARAKVSIRDLGVRRSMELFHLAVVLLSNGSLDDKLGSSSGSWTIYGYRQHRVRDPIKWFNPDFSGDDLARYNVENLFYMMRYKKFGDPRFVSHSFLGTKMPFFFELKDRVVDYYVEYMKNHTLGIAPEHLDFLREPDAHARIAEMYEEIFNPGLIDRKYLEKSSSSYVFYLLAIIPILFIISILGYFYVRHCDIPRVGDHSVQFKRLYTGHDEKQLVPEDASSMDNCDFRILVASQV
uniref:C-type lectin domain-containing protein n=1 Tax=Steinernema glaseri TaxID=37863 RepID=A0A1I8AQD6_9BILA